MAQTDKSKGEHEHHTHGGGKYTALLNTGADCGHVGQVYLVHCYVVLGQGEEEMATCQCQAVAGFLLLGHTPSV